MLFLILESCFLLTARLRASSPNNAGTIARVTNTEFSDNDFGEEQEENMADDGKDIAFFQSLWNIKMC